MISIKGAYLNGRNGEDELELGRKNKLIIKLSTGEEIEVELFEREEGRIGIRNNKGGLSVRPESSNFISVEPVDYFS